MHVKKTHIRWINSSRPNIPHFINLTKSIWILNLVLSLQIFSYIHLAVDLKSGRSYPNLHSLATPFLQFFFQSDSIYLHNPSDQTTDHQSPSWQRWMPFPGNVRMDQSATQYVAAHISQKYHSASWNAA